MPLFSILFVYADTPLLLYYTPLLLPFTLPPLLPLLFADIDDFAILLFAAAAIFFALMPAAAIFC